MKRYWIVFGLCLLPWFTHAEQRFHEKEYYLGKWCRFQSGEIDYRAKDKTPVDCLLDTHAVAFEFADKWTEAIDRSLDYAKETGKDAAIVLILERLEDEGLLKEMKQTIRKEDLPIEVWVIQRFQKEKKI